MGDESRKSAPTKKPRRRGRTSKPAASASRPRATRKRATPAAVLADRRRAIAFGTGALAGTLLVAAVVLYVGYGRSSRKQPGPAVEIDWPAGLDANAAADLLAERGVVKNASALAFFLRATGGTSRFVAGPHVFFEGEAPWDIRRSLERSDRRPVVRFTIPEGFHRFDVATRLERMHVAGRHAFLAASADPALLDELGIEKAGSVGAESAEGYLFPATYALPIDSDPRDVVRRLVAEADKRWASLVASHADGLASLRSTLGFTRRDVITLASIVEKEAIADDERPIIASVFLNRLLDPSFTSHRLQSDPTAMYGCVAAPDEAPSCAGYAGKATPAINRDPKNRYSTYTHARLPPGPIASPGEKSIAAVLAPASTHFFYFVAAGKGRHTFSETLDAHNAAVRQRAAAVP